MQTLDPPLVSALAALCAAMLMVYAGVGKGLLSWRPDAVRRRRQPRKPRRQRQEAMDLGRPALRRRPPGRRWTRCSPSRLDACGCPPQGAVRRAMARSSGSGRRGSRGGLRTRGSREARGDAA